MVFKNVTLILQIFSCTAAARLSAKGQVFLAIPCPSFLQHQVKIHLLLCKQLLELSKSLYKSLYSIKEHEIRETEARQEVIDLLSAMARNRKVSSSMC